VSAVAFDPAPLLDQLARTLEDARLSDDEKRAIVAAVRDATPPEDGLRQLRNRAFTMARAKTADAAQLELLQWLEGVVRSLDAARAPAGEPRQSACFSPGDDCLSTIRSHLRDARRSVDLCVFTISDDRITAEILAAHARGVRLRLLTDNEKEHDAGSDIARLRGAGIATVVDRTAAHMHHKFAIIDGARLLNGSYNWTRSASDVNEENLVVSHDPRLVAAFQRQFDRLWDRLGAR
jgi:mitochondrial cardiolipin hydrolase